MTETATTDELTPAAIRERVGPLLALDGWPRDRLVERQRAALRDVLAHAVARSPYYREALGPDAADADLADLPTLPKALLMEQFDRIVTDPALRVEDLRAFLAQAEPSASFEGRYRVFATSGSTGEPGLFVYSHAEFAHWIAVGLARLARIGVGPDTRLVAVGAPADAHITRQLFAAFQSGREGVPRLSVLTPLDEMVAALNAYRPEALIAYAGVLGLLAQEQLEGRLAIEPAVAVATSEVLTDETVGRVEAAWGAAPVNVYAATEAPGVAMASLDRVGMHVCEESVVLEVVDDDGAPAPAGEPGSKVLLTSLVNRAQPLIRYELADAVVLEDGPDPSGRPFTRIARVDGRSGDFLVFYGGVKVHPFRVRSPFTALIDVRQYQVVHERDGTVRARVVPRPSAPSDLPERVRTAIAAELEHAGVAAPVVAVDVVDELERDPGHAAKLQLVVTAG
jgi:phenylacetate-coenzyme A ligase PaaK-like adenylate-forming protein